MTAHATADRDPLDILPALVLKQPAHDEREFLREFFDHGMDQACGFRVSLFQGLVEFLFPDLGTRPLAEWVAPLFDQWLAGLVENGRQSLLARAVAQETAIVLEFDIAGNDVNTGKPRASVSTQQRCFRRPALAHGRSTNAAVPSSFCSPTDGSSRTCSHCRNSAGPAT